MEDFNLGLVIAWVINFLLLVVIFRKALGDTIVKQVEERKIMIAKLKKADSEYQRIISEAKQQAETMISEAEQEKNKLIHEAHLVAEDEKMKILQDGQNKVEAMKQNAALENQKLERQLKEEWVDSVKQTSKKVVKRLLKHNKELSDDYFWVLVEDLQGKAL